MNASSLYSLPEIRTLSLSWRGGEHWRRNQDSLDGSPGPTKRKSESTGKELLFEVWGMWEQEKTPPKSPRSPRDLWLKDSEGQDERLLTIPKCQRLPDEQWGCSSFQRSQGPQVGGKHYLVQEWEQTAMTGCFRVGTRMRWVIPYFSFIFPLLPTFSFFTFQLSSIC